MSRRRAHGYQLLRPFRVSRASCASCAVMAFKSSNLVTPILASTSKRLNPRALLFRSFVPRTISHAYRNLDISYPP